MTNNDEEKKKPDLDKLTEELDPDKINEKVELPHVKAHHKYLPKLENKVSVDNYEDFRKQIIAYMKHHHKEIYKEEMSDDRAFSRAKEILRATFEKQGGFVWAYKQARRGKLGDVIKALANFEENEHRRSYIENVFGQVDPLDWDSHVGLVKQYKLKYGQFLHKRIRRKSDEQLAHDWRDLIDNHVQVVENAKTHLEKYEPKKKEYKPKEAA